MTAPPPFAVLIGQAVYITAQGHWQPARRSDRPVGLAVDVTDPQAVRIGHKGQMLTLTGHGYPLGVDLLASQTHAGALVPFRRPHRETERPGPGETPSLSRLAVATDPDTILVM